MKFTPTDLESINCIRGLCIDAVEEANSGHPGMPLGTAPLAYVLWKHFLKFSSQNPNEKLISSWLTSLKYNRNFYAARLFQKLIRIWLRQNPHFLEKYDFVVPLPTHPYKFFLRGFNPSSYLIKNLFDTKKLINIADKTRWTKPQTSLQYYQRIKILNKKIFQISDKVKEKKVLVFDDVVTTKSSVLNLVRQIKKKKAKEVDVLCLARVFL